MSVDKTYRCAARYCPGLPYAASEQAHPFSCTEPPVKAWSRPGEQGGDWTDAAKMKGTRYAGTSGQAEWPPKGDGERRFWPVVQLTTDLDDAVADALNIPRPPRAWPPMGPITDAEVDAAEACVAELMPWTTTHGVIAPSEASALAERVATLTVERDDLRETVDQIAEHVDAKTRGASPAFARLLRDEVRLFVANLTRERDTAVDAFHRCRIERDQARTSGDAAAFVWADERSALIGERDAARAEVARLTESRDDWREASKQTTADLIDSRAEVARLTAELNAAADRGWTFTP